MQKDIEMWNKARNHWAFPAAIGSLIGGVLSTIVIYVTLGPLEPEFVAIFMLLFYVGSLGLLGAVVGAFFSCILIIVFVFRSEPYGEFGEKEKVAIKSHRILFGVSGLFFTFIINVVFFFWAIQ